MFVVYIRRTVATITAGEQAFHPPFYAGEYRFNFHIGVVGYGVSGLSAILNWTVSPRSKTERRVLVSRIAGKECVLGADGGLQGCFAQSAEFPLCAREFRTYGVYFVLLERDV
jgi:hypothetical protein